MSKILNSTIISGTVPKMIETSDHFIINSQVYQKETLDPIKLNTVYSSSRDTDILMNTYAKVNSDINFEYCSTNTVITDKYDPKYCYALYIDRSAILIVTKYITNDDGTVEQALTNYTSASSLTYFQIFSQDVNYIYGYYTNNSYQQVIFKISKSNLSFSLTTINGSYSKIKLLQDTPLYIFYAYSTDADNYYIGRYNKGTNSKTDIYNDNGTTTSGYYSYFRPMQINDNEILSLRATKSFNSTGLDNLMLKKYIIDYDYEKIYSKTLELDCSLVPKGYIQKINSTTYFTETVYFKKNGNEYFSFWNKQDKTLYLAKKTAENVYAIIQVYELSNSYYGLIPYNNGESLIMFNTTSIDFISFRDLEEKFEFASSVKGNFYSLGIDKNNTIWIHNTDGSVDMVGLNVPMIAEAVFVDQQLDYKNTDIETFIEVFSKNFSGSLIETNVEIFLTGPIHFSDTNSKKKKIRTSANNTIRIPVTIVNSGLVETNVKIL